MQETTPETVVQLELSLSLRVCLKGSPNKGGRRERAQRLRCSRCLRTTPTSSHSTKRLEAYAHATQIQAKIGLTVAVNILSRRTP